MNRNLVIIMSLALTGIILLQTLWISNAVALKNEEFNRDVNKALSSAALLLELKEQPGLLSGNCDTPQTNPLAQKIYAPSAYCGRINPYEYRYSEFTATDEAELPGREVFVKLKNNDRENNHAELIRVGNEDDMKRIIQQTSAATGSFRTLELTAQLNVSDIANRININDLLYSIRGFLASRNIDIPFEYGIFNGDKTDSLVMHSNGFVHGDDVLSFRVRLFPNDILPRNNSLVITFSDRNSYILDSIMSVLLLSLLFTAVIISIFYYTLRIIVRQKKLADIKNDFISNMTHEFKTPLATISLAIDAVSDSRVLNDKEKIMHYSSIIKEENKRMNAHVETVLQMALTERNDMEMNTDDINVHQLLEESLNDFYLQLEHKNSTRELNLNAGHFIISGDEFHLSKAIKNIIDNAIKYSGNNIDLTISTWNENRDLLVEISDKGIGISKENQRYIFDKFYRVQNGNIHDVKGFGLGLSYTRNILEKHHATIFVKSEINKGTSFIIRFKTDNNE